MEINQMRQTEYFIARGGFEMKNTASKFTVWCWLAAASFLGGCITLYKGIDKMTNYYYNSEYSSRLVNAYVGGDAYNYIINGTYAIAFFVLTAWIFYHNLNLPILMGVERRGSTVIFDGAPQSVKEHNVKLSRNGIIYATVEKTDKKAEKVRTIPAPCC